MMKTIYLRRENEILSPPWMNPVLLSLLETAYKSQIFFFNHEKPKKEQRRYRKISKWKLFETFLDKW